MHSPSTPGRAGSAGSATSPSRSGRPKAAAAEGQRRLPCSGLVRSVTATRLARRLAESCGERRGVAGAGKLGSCTRHSGLLANERRTPGRSEPIRNEEVLSGIKRGRERGSPGVKLKLNPVKP